MAASNTHGMSCEEGASNDGGPNGLDLMDSVNFIDATLGSRSGCLATQLPDTPVKPPSKRVKSDSREKGEILEAIRELARKHDESFQKISSIEKTTVSTSKQMEKLTSTVQQLTMEVMQQKQTTEGMKDEIHALQAENKILKPNIADCQRYSRNWSLKLHGVKEEDGEDVRCRVINILEKVAPRIRDKLKEGVDIVHRIGPRRQDGSKRSIIILFALRLLRDAVWSEAKGSKFLLDNNLRITEALSPEDKAARKKLWPLVKKARDEGKKASFRGPFVFINGKKIYSTEVTGT
ncbi:hypothetical protein DPEC_G00151050 [Dallia pectoralis]|uniref:Uncharacterized protein n=1 Tax=Dallia pectoralis TaxID=75939 RepID=A0ACC2GJB7_DALPE|nr:hypothetical protein DPEC_G00151050 [Dallia pectoralis]